MFRNPTLTGLVGLIMTLSAVVATAQRNCGAMEVLARQLMEDPALRDQMDAIEYQIQNFRAQGGAQDRLVVTIPVVVNVVWNTAAENVSDQQIQTQMEVLNADFRRLNADAGNTPAVWQSIAADCEINFCLATQDPSGGSTNGIRRRQTTVTAFSTNDAVKFTAQGGLDIWDRNKYMNLWVCDLSGGLLGYAQFPGGAAATDGIVIDYQYFGTIGSTPPFNLGRTATHEVGHWLNLRHIWGDDGTACTGSDQVSDTPNQADENYACPAFPAISCTNGPNGDMFMNYMDYTDDGCMNLFTSGQKNRMQALFAAGGARIALLSSPGCNPPSATCGTPAGLSATNISQSSATLNWGAVSGAGTYNLQWKVSTSGTWTTVTGLTTNQYNLSGLSGNTTYNFKVQAVCNGVSGAYAPAASFTTLSGACTDPYESNNTRATAKIIPVNTDITALINTTTDVDWLRFSNSASTPRIKLDLTGLPADYDLQLYRNNTLLATSQNVGAANEQIILNTTQVSSAYYARVYGYQGAYNAAQCYTLRASLSASNWRSDGSAEEEGETIEIPVSIVYKPFGMFPNPAEDALTLEIPVTSAEEVQVLIVGIDGKNRLSRKEWLTPTSATLHLDLTNLAAGIYFVQVKQGENINTRKLIKN